MHGSQSSVRRNIVLGKLRSFIGYVLVFFSILMLIVGSSDDISDEAVGVSFFFFVILLAIGVLSIRKGMRIKRTVKRYKIYVSLISAQNIVSVSRIATATGKSVEHVRSDLQDMVEKKFFSDAVIDVVADEIVIRSKSVVLAEQMTHETFQCHTCGGSSRIMKGAPRFCNYCGSAL
ncbi:MAG: hypothetical protein LBC99_03245 [Spirochaetota bacterium]|nr:hypothetical protein [Spirochaetota bacterium]